MREIIGDQTYSKIDGNIGLYGEKDLASYFYFFCPVCPDNEVVRIIDYGINSKMGFNLLNKSYKNKAKVQFTLAFHLVCEKCGHQDYIKISNMGKQTGSSENILPVSDT